MSNRHDVTNWYDAVISVFNEGVDWNDPELCEATDNAVRSLMGLVTAAERCQARRQIRVAEATIRRAKERLGVE